MLSSFQRGLRVVSYKKAVYSLGGLKVSEVTLFFDFGLRTKLMKTTF